MVTVEVDNTFDAGKTVATVGLGVAGGAAVSDGVGDGIGLQDGSLASIGGAILLAIGFMVLATKTDNDIGQELAIGASGGAGLRALSELLSGANMGAAPTSRALRAPNLSAPRRAVRANIGLGETPSRTPSQRRRSRAEVDTWG